MKHLLPAGDRPVEIIENKGEMNRRMVCIITEKGSQVNENGDVEPAKLLRGASRNGMLTFRRLSDKLDPSLTCRIR
jgi:hypothetical protein